MLTVSDEYNYHIESDVQTVKPYVIATWADSRHLENVRLISTEDPFFQKTEDLIPAKYLNFTDAQRFDFMTNNTSNIQDLSSYEQHGKDVGSVAFQQGVIVTSETSSKSLQTTSYLQCNGTTNSWASCPDHSRLDITSGLLDIRVLLKLDAYTGSEQTLVAKWGSTTAGQSYKFSIDTNGNLKLMWTNGTTSATRTSSSSISSLNFISVRALLTISTGTVVFYTSEDNSIWTQLGTTQTGTAVTPVNSTSSLYVGYDNTGVTTNMAKGKILDIYLYSGADLQSLTVAARPDFRNLGSGTWAVGGTTNTDEAGNAWTVAAGASIGGVSYIDAGASATATDTFLNSQDNLMVETIIKMDKAALAFPSVFQASPGTDKGHIVSRCSSTTSTNKHFEIYVQGNKIKASIFSGSDETLLTAINVINTATTYHVVLCLNKIANSTTRLATLIINGVVQEQKMMAAAPNSPTANVYIGAFNNAGSIINLLTGLKVGFFAIYNQSSVQFSPQAFGYARYKAGLIAKTYPYSDYLDSYEVINNRQDESFYWAFLDSKTNNNILSKTNNNFYLVEPDPDYKKHEYGWWSTQKSDSAGNFTNKPKIFIEFDSRKINAINLATSSYFNKIKQ